LAWLTDVDSIMRVVHELTVSDKNFLPALNVQATTMAISDYGLYAPELAARKTPQAMTAMSRNFRPTYLELSMDNNTFGFNFASLENSTTTLLYLDCASHV